MPRAKPKKRPVAPEDLLRLILPSDPRLSPDGSRVLFTRKHVGEKNAYATDLWVVSVEGGEPTRFTSGGKDSHGRWSPDGTRVAFKSGRNRPRSQVFVMPATGGEATALTDYPEGSIGSFKWSPDGTQIAVAFRPTAEEWTEAAAKRREEGGQSLPPRVIDHAIYRLDGDGTFGHERFHLDLVDVKTGKTRRIFDRNQGLSFSFDWSPDSRELAIAANLDERSYSRPWRERLYRLDARSGRLRLIPGQKDGTLGPVAWSPDGRLIAYAGRAGRDGSWGDTNAHVFVCDAETGKTRNLTASEDYCVATATLGDSREVSFEASLAWHPDGDRLLTTIGWHGESHLASIDAARGKISFLTRGAHEHTLGDVHADGRHVTFLRGSAIEPAEIHVGTLSQRGIEPRKLTRFNSPLLAELELARPEEHWVDSTDGARVQLWVLRPARALAKEKVPALLAIHGGPHGQYGLTFFHELQLHAARGYAVFYGNPRGSKGYGEAHATAIHGDWGNKDWDDVQAMTRLMQSTPWVDTKRMGIMGGSYGGYMTNWAIARTHAFAAAITDRCVSNLLSMAGSSDIIMSPDEYWTGGPWDRPETLWAQSPIAHFASVRTPTLVIHSEGDLRCNVEQGDQVYAALSLLGVPTRYVRYPPTSSHGLSRSGPPDLRLHRLGQMLEWWDRYLGRARKKKS